MAAPIVALWAIGTSVGLGTIANGAIVTAGYVFAVVVGALLLRRQGTSWLALGLSAPSNRWRTVAAGVGAAVAGAVVFVGVQVVLVWVVTAAGFQVGGLDQSRFNPVEGNLFVYLLLVGTAWTAIAVGEEWCYRAFLITRLVDHAGVRDGLAVVLAGAVFGLVHFAEGPVGIASNGALGVLFGWIYLRSGRNLWITVIAHGLLNTARFTLLYAGVA